MIVNKGFEFSSNKYNNINDGDIKLINKIPGPVVHIDSNKLECTKDFLVEFINSKPVFKQNLINHATPTIIQTITIKRYKL